MGVGAWVNISALLNNRGPAVLRSANAAVYGSRTVAHETYFQQHGGALRNSGIPNHQDSAFSLPGKARHRLQKHGVNLP